MENPPCEHCGEPVPGKGLVCPKCGKVRASEYGPGAIPPYPEGYEAPSQPSGFASSCFAALAVVAIALGVLGLGGLLVCSTMFR